MVYAEYLKTLRWKRIKRALRKLYPTCQICKKKKSKDVHHLTYTTLGKEREYDVLVLCRTCHIGLIHKRKRASAAKYLDDLIVKRTVGKKGEQLPIL